MKKLMMLLLSLMVLTFAAVPAHAAKKTDAGEALAKAEAERRAELENTEWELQMLPQGGKGKGPLSEKFVFNGDKVSMKMLTDKGFVPAGYTLTAFPDSPRGTWESFQAIKDGKETLSMRGDWYGERMDGVVSMSFDEGKRIETYNFSTQKKITLKGATESASPGTAASPVSEPSSVLVSKESLAKKTQSSGVLSSNETPVEEPASSEAEGTES